jgi:hypothetical protein
MAYVSVIGYMFSIVFFSIGTSCAIGAIACGLIENQGMRLRKCHFHDM